MIPHHECTEEDWKQFAPTAADSIDGFKQIKEGPNRGFFCLDWSEDLIVYGNERSRNYQVIEILVLPCNYLHVNENDEVVGDSIHPECVADLNA